jgi:hypothetical protein
MFSQEPCLSESLVQERLAKALRGAEAHRLRRQARELLRQSSSPDQDQLSQQGRHLLYRLAVQMMALGQWVDQNGLPAPLQGESG